MYSKANPVALKGSASFIQGNLTILSDRENKALSFGVISRTSVNITTTDIENTSNQINQRQVVPKLTKELYPAAISDNQSVNLTQARFLRVSDRYILLILSTKGIFFFEEDGVNLLSFHAFKNIRPTQSEETTYARGVAVIKPNIVAIGTCSGIIQLYDIPPKGSNITLVEEINDKTFQSGISDLVVDRSGSFMCAGDTSGNIAIFKIKSIDNIKFSNSIREKNSCLCLNIWENYLIGAFSNGLICFYDLQTGVKTADISAHGRWINSLDVKEDKLVSAGEDCFFRVWELIEVNGKLKINHVQSEHIPDSYLCSAKFIKGTREICVSVFDSNEIQIYKS